MRKFIIHLLGGFTTGECTQSIIAAALTSRALVTSNILSMAKSLYSRPADEWASLMYDYIEFKHDKYPDIEAKKEGNKLVLTIEDVEPELNDNDNEE